MRTVEQAVLEVLIYALRQGSNRVGIQAVEAAHPRYTMSGRARIRSLRLRGLVKYDYDNRDNTYVIHSSLDDLYRAVAAVTGKYKGAPAVTVVAAGAVHKAREVATSASPADIDTEAIKEFINSL